MPSTITRSDGVETGADDPEAVAQIADLDLLRRDHVVEADGQDDVVRLIRQHGGVRHEQGWRRRGDFDADAGEAARRQETVGIRDGGAGMDRAAGAIEGVVDEVERALMGEVGSRRRARSAPCRRAGRPASDVRAGTSCSRPRSCRSSDRSGRSRRVVASKVVGLVPARLPEIRLPTETR